MYPSKSPPETQQSESLLSDDDQGGSQGSDTVYDESQVGMAGLLTRMNRQFETQLEHMQEALQETLGVRLTGVTEAITQQTTEMKKTLAGITEQTTDLKSSLVGLSAGLAATTSTLQHIETRLSEQTTSLSSTLQHIDNRLSQQTISYASLNAVLEKLSAKLDTTANAAPTSTPIRDNVVPEEPDPTNISVPATTSNDTIPATSAASTTSELVHDGTSDGTGIGVAPGARASTATRVDPSTNPILDATADSALAHLVRERASFDDPALRANTVWRHTQDVRATTMASSPTTVSPPYAQDSRATTTQDVRATALATHPHSITPFRPPGDHARVRYALGTTTPHYTQTLLQDHMPPTRQVPHPTNDELSDHRPAPISTDIDGDDRTWPGGMIQSPRYIDRRRLITEKKIHPSNIEQLADIGYHGGVSGRSEIDMPFVHSCGYRSSISGSDVIAAYGEIMLLHAYTLERWENARTQQWGPQLERIIEKGLPTLPRLPGLAMEEIIDFYDKLQPVSALYLLPIVPFDCINVNMGYEALCPPGLGTRRYARIGRVLIEVLPRILPKLHSQVNTIIAMVRQESNNGYDLLWRILELGVPGFDPSVPIRVPVWKDDDIFDFAAAFCLYYRLLAKKGMQYDDRSRSVTFLQAITAPAYVDAANTILINVHNFYSSEFDATLPPALCIMGIANQLHEQAVKRAAAVIPRARRLAHAQDDAYDYQPEYPSASRMDGNRRWPDRTASADRQPRPERGYRDDTRQDRYDRGRDGPIGRSGHGAPRPVVQGSRGPPRQTSSRGRYVRPDRNRGAYLPDTICDACRRPGHVAATCDVLAMALFIEKYKQDISSDLKDKLERDWIARWKDTVGSHRPPRRVMKTYVDHLDISVDELDDLLCWECWPDDEHLPEDADDGPVGSA